MTTRNKYLLAIIPVLLVGSIIYFLSDIVAYVVIAWVLSMIGAPIVKFLRRYLGKNASAAITLAGFVLFLTLLVWVFVPPLLTQARNLAGVDYNSIVNSLEEPINDWQSWLEDRGLISSDSFSPKEEGDVEPIEETPLTEVIRLDSTLYPELNGGQDITFLIQVNNDNSMLPYEESESDHDLHLSFFDKAKQNLYSFLNPSLIPKLLSNVIGTLGNFLIGLMSVLFIAFFFLKEHGLFNNMVSAALPTQYENKAQNAIQQSSDLLIRYFIGVLTQMTIITVFVSILLSILGVKNALLIGFFAALMNVIPYIGPIIGAAFAIIITVSSNLDMAFYSGLLPLMTKVLIVFMIMQLLDNFILQPNIFSKSVKAHPLEIFIVVLIGAKIGGIGGMVLAIPLYTVLRVLGKVFFSEFKVVQQITRNI
jgi:predicted PurR-regulated permease PerM